MPLYLCSTEDRKRVPFLSVVYLSRGTLPPKRGKRALLGDLAHLASAPHQASLSSNRSTASFHAKAAPSSGKQPGPETEKSDRQTRNKTQPDATRGWGTRYFCSFCFLILACCVVLLFWFVLLFVLLFVCFDCFVCFVCFACFVALFVFASFLKSKLSFPLIGGLDWWFGLVVWVGVPFALTKQGATSKPPSKPPTPWLPESCWSYGGMQESWVYDKMGDPHKMGGFLAVSF